jgi:molybdopterin converting factor small subunit
MPSRKRLTEEALMQITIEYAAQAKQAAGTGRECLDLAPPLCVRDLLPQLARRHGEALARLLLTADGAPQPALLVFVGDEQVAPDAPRALRPGDVLTILPPIAGG